MSEAVEAYHLPEPGRSEPCLACGVGAEPCRSDQLFAAQKKCCLACRHLVPGCKCQACDPPGLEMCWFCEGYGNTWQGRPTPRKVCADLEIAAFRARPDLYRWGEDWDRCHHCRESGMLPRALAHRAASPGSTIYSCRRCHATFESVEEPQRCPKNQGGCGRAARATLLLRCKYPPPVEPGRIRLEVIA